jgi:hypothetical protein
VVPEHAAAPGGRRIKLGFLRLHAGSPAKGSPLYVLAGGPAAA